ncbi:NB-ARC domain-containing protein [Catenulispora rubra]|uniref:NB-ARC domain-containing protein n=1 Tax=Catenulispora rubra TaxID=280293 RepID=UPI0018924474|nr:NB-ARC domain-containing protein [Catenulispora rubra]
MDQPDFHMSGSASNVVHAGSVSGGIHITTSKPPRPKPRLLPAGVHGFVNRVRELGTLDAVLAAAAEDAPRIVLLVGTAGVGKTSVALRWAHLVREQFPDGQLYINLRGYDPGEPVPADLALERFLRVLGVNPEEIPTGLEERSDLFRSLVADRQILIVLDNAATVDQVRPLLPGTESCLTLVTSRSQLPALVARDGARRVAVETLSPQSSVALLRKVTMDYRPADPETDTAELARLCAYLPLALRIAAERAAARPWLSLADLASELTSESGLWEALSAEDETDADAVRTVFAWSYRALPAPAARVFRLLGLHPAPEFGLHAAAALAELTPMETRRLLALLAGAHLLEEVGSGRYQFHDLLRAYAADLARQEETEESRERSVKRLLDFYLYAAASAQPRDRMAPIDVSGGETVPALPDLDNADATRTWYQAERANLMAAAQAAAAHGADRVAWQIPALVQEINGGLDPADTWTSVKVGGLEAARRSGDHYGEGVSMLGLAVGDKYAGRLDVSRERFTAAADAFDAAGSLVGRAHAENGLGLVAMLIRDFDAAEAHFSSGLETARCVADPALAVPALMNLGSVRGAVGEFSTAQNLLDEAVALARQVGDQANETEALIELSVVLRNTGDLNSARRANNETLQVCHETGNQRQEAHALLEKARIDLADGQPAEALVSSHAAASAFGGLGDNDREAVAWGLTGTAYSHLGRHEEAVAFLKQAASTHQDLGRAWLHSQDLLDLAAALARSGDRAGALEHRRRAAAELATFSDPVASALRAGIDESVNG